jgi:hypothetical protein
MHEIEDFFKNLGYEPIWYGDEWRYWLTICNDRGENVLEVDYDTRLNVMLGDFEKIYNDPMKAIKYSYVLYYPSFKNLLDDLFGKKTPALHEVSWSLIGSTEEYRDLKKDIAYVCHDVIDAACIPEICIMDIVNTFKKHGYIITKE